VTARRGLNLDVAAGRVKPSRKPLNNEQLVSLFNIRVNTECTDAWSFWLAFLSPKLRHLKHHRFQSVPRILFSILQNCARLH
jgi:hypothetical protein